MWPGRSSFGTLNVSSLCLWRWLNSPLALRFLNKSGDPLWAPHWVQHCVWWLSHSLKKSGTEPTAPPSAPWILQLASFAMWTTDCACRTPAGTTKSASPISFTRSSTVIPSFWKRNRTRSSWAFASSSSLLPFATALHATSTRSWRHSPHHLWPSNFRVLFHDYFWSPNVRTLHTNEHEVLPHCTVCTDLQVLPSPILPLPPSRSVNTYTFPHCGKILNCHAASAYVSLFTSWWTFDLFGPHVNLYDLGVVRFQLAYPQTRLHLLLGPYSTLRHGFLVSYYVNSDSRTSVSSISSWCSPCLPSPTSSNGATTTHAHSQHWTYSSSQYRRMESTWWATTTLLGPDQRLHWQCPHPITGYCGGRDTYGWTGGNPSPWATPPCCRSVTWCPTCTLEAFY